jgi:hypothetical protein
MSLDVNRWLLIVVVILCLLGLLLFARGPEHHRGPENVGALSARLAVTGGATHG